MSFTNSSLAGEINVQSTDAMRVNGQEGAPPLPQNDSKSGEEYADADGEYEEDVEVSTDDESVDSETDENEEDEDESVQDSENEEVDGTDEENIEVEAENGEEREESDESDGGEERLVTKSDVHRQLEISDGSGFRVHSVESSKKERSLDSDVEIVKTSTHRKFQVHDINRHAKGMLHSASHALSAVVVHAGHGNQRCDMSKITAQCNTSNHTAHGDINYSNHAIEHHESEYTYPGYTTHAESTAFIESITS